MYKGTKEEKATLRKRWKKWYSTKENKEKRKTYNRIYRMKNRKKLNEYLRKYLIKTGKNYQREDANERLKIHQWVEKQLGIRKKCDICGTTNPNRRYQWSNKDHKYTKDLDKWQRVCPTCHREYDMKYNGTKTYKKPVLYK